MRGCRSTERLSAYINFSGNQKFRFSRWVHYHNRHYTKKKTHSKKRHWSWFSWAELHYNWQIKINTSPPRHNNWRWLVAMSDSKWTQFYESIFGSWKELSGWYKVVSHPLNKQENGKHSPENPNSLHPAGKALLHQRNRHRTQMGAHLLQFWCWSDLRVDQNLINLH